MRELSNNLLKKSELTACLCAPGVVAEALELLMRGEAAQAEFAACLRFDPVLALRLHEKELLDLDAPVSKYLPAGPCSSSRWMPRTCRSSACTVS